MVAHICNLSTQEAEAELPQVQGQPGLNNEFQGRLTKVRYCLETNKELSKCTEDEPVLMVQWTYPPAVSS